MISKEQYEQAIKEFIANGGVIEQIPTGKSSPDAGNSAWGNNRTRAKSKEVTDITDINVDNLE